MEEDVFHRLVKLISDKTGLRLDGQDGGTLRRIAAARMALHKCSTPEQYRDMLEADTAKGRLEREELISLLTVGESYFFRDKGQFELLRNTIMPEIVERRKTGRTLNIWSAGCSTGEEPYSLAILLYEIVPDISDWRIQIMGTDIKEEFLQKARKGVYGEWSFRTVPENVRKKYFVEKGGRFELDPIIKNMVTFRRANLLDAALAGAADETHGMDLIFCRNVFIYYRRRTAAMIVEKMAESLREGGYLITGHWELFSSPSGKLAPRLFPQSVAYQRLAESPAETPVSSVPPVFPAALIPSTPDVIFHFDNEASRQAASRLEKEPRNIPDDFRSLCLAAHAFADVGEHGRALECLRKAIAVNPISTEPYYLLARIAEERGDLDAAKENLGKVIYLEPASVAAYLDIAGIHESAGDMEKARKMRMAALDILRKLPKENIVEPYGTTAAAVARHMELLLFG